MYLYTIYINRVSTLCFHLRSSPIGIICGGAYRRCKACVSETAEGVYTWGAYRQRDMVLMHVALDKILLK